MRITIHGDPRAGRVTLNGCELTPERSLALYNHSPSGFAWGYGGSGPAQLALAILLEAGVGEAEAVNLHQNFKWEHVARWPYGEAFTDTIDLGQWITMQRVVVRAIEDAELQPSRWRW